MTLEDLGWDARRTVELKKMGYPLASAARVLIERRGRYTLRTSEGETRARLAPQYRRELTNPGDRPAVGDWVVLEQVEDVIQICARLPRTSKFSRRRAGDQTVEQVVAANVDTVWIVSAMGQDVNARRFERYLTLAWESGASPVIVLTKADLFEDHSEFIEIAQASALGVNIHCVSNKSGSGLANLEQYLAPGRTVALLGSSGVGKSSIINALSSTERMAVGEVREGDQKGRHTTTHRELLQLPCGGLVIDTPGMRELQLWESDEGLDQTFRDLVKHGENCRFRDCSHVHEPGCAVREAVQTGALDQGRYQSYVKLRAELDYLDRREDPWALREEKQKDKTLHKSLRSHPKYKK